METGKHLRSVARCTGDSEIWSMARSVQWRRVRPDAVARRADEALRKTLYIVHQSGPTGFVLKEDHSEEKHKVLLGTTHQCSCSVYKREKELCVHILWVLLKRFRVPPESPISFQLGLVEREINETLSGRLRQQSPKCNGRTHKAGTNCKVVRRDIAPDDVCAICREEFCVRTQPITYCRYGCGQNVHVRCMKVWAEHQAKGGSVRCPLCREEFGTLKEICSQLHKPGCRQLYKERNSTHLGVVCNHCRTCPITGMCYHCTTCSSYHLCQTCFCSNQVHITHPFECRKHPSHPWRDAIRPTIPNLASSSSPPFFPSSSSSPFLPSLVNSLQTRSLTDRDYELLRNLDSLTIGAPSHLQRGDEGERGGRERRWRRQWRREGGRGREMFEGGGVKNADDKAALILSGLGLGQTNTTSYSETPHTHSPIAPSPGMNWGRKLPSQTPHRLRQSPGHLPRPLPPLVYKPHPSQAVAAVGDKHCCLGSQLVISGIKHPSLASHTPH